MTRKPRILWVGEASYMSTGFATYANEVLRRLHDTGKYDIVELASFGDGSDPQDHRWRLVPWKFIPVMPNRHNTKECQAYYANPNLAFGEFRFEQACLETKPDVVCDIRDWWYLEFEERSPFRRFYNWCIMPTIDAAPQDERWLASFQNADAVFTYTDWALSVLRQQSPGIKLKCAAPPGADLVNFKPIGDKAAHRSRLGLPEDALIVGTVMRNQPRKLYPELILAFKRFLEIAPPEISKRAYLYLHTSYPDSWDLPLLLKEAGISHKCIFTYLCKNCQQCFPMHFQEARAVCRKCFAPAAHLPSTKAGVSRNVLAEMMNLFDVYVQYANSEGFGMPMAEAAACGVPIMAIDYSAMSDVVRKLQGFPIKVERMYRNPDMPCWRALPDNNAFAQQLVDIFSAPRDFLSVCGASARLACEEFYDYDKTAKIWETYIDSVPLQDLWATPATQHKPIRDIPQGLSDEQFVKWGLINIAGRPDLVDSWHAMRMVRDLTWNYSTSAPGGLYISDLSGLSTKNAHRSFDRTNAVQELVKICDHRNHWEAMRAKS